MSMLESLDLLEAINRLERSYDLDLFKDLGDGYWIGSQQHVDSDSSKVDLSLYHLVEPRGATDKFAEAWEFIGYLNVPTYNPSGPEIEQAGKALKAKHQQNPESALLKTTTSEVAKKKKEPNADISPMAEDAYDSVKNAITYRIVNQHMDLITKYGADKVIDAIDSVADFHSDAEEIGSSDISAFVRQVLDTLGHMAEMRRLSGLQIAETVVDQAAIDALTAKYSKKMINEAEYQGRKVALGKPMRGDVAKFKVYVKDPKTGNVKKVNFGDKDMEIKRDNPARRKNFRARHNCAGKKDRTKAGYWSCRLWSTKKVSDVLKVK